MANGSNLQMPIFKKEKYFAQTHCLSRTQPKSWDKSNFSGVWDDWRTCHLTKEYRARTEGVGRPRMQLIPKTSLFQEQFDRQHSSDEVQDMLQADDIKKRIVQERHWIILRFFKLNGDSWYLPVLMYNGPSDTFQSYQRGSDGSAYSGSHCDSEVL